mmetsp:Transcript_10291/g.29365  ORF Transcript_10291/g.29365 Transcript_10291/m.29365 type:complete len:229 (+) Transcript_10291:553-1239(+)
MGARQGGSLLLPLVAIVVRGLRCREAAKCRPGRPPDTGGVPRPGSAWLWTVALRLCLDAGNKFPVNATARRGPPVRRCRRMIMMAARRGNPRLQGAAGRLVATALQASALCVRPTVWWRGLRRPREATVARDGLLPKEATLQISWAARGVRCHALTSYPRVAAPGTGGLHGYHWRDRDGQLTAELVHESTHDGSSDVGRQAVCVNESTHVLQLLDGKRNHSMPGSDLI